MVLYVRKTAIQQIVTPGGGRGLWGGGGGSSELEGTASFLHQREMKRKLKIYIAHSLLDSEAPLVDVISSAAHFLLNRVWRNIHIKRRHLRRPCGDTDINSRRKTEEEEEEARGDDSFQAIRWFGSWCSIEMRVLVNSVERLKIWRKRVKTLAAYHCVFLVNEENTREKVYILVKQWKERWMCTHCRSV